MMVELCVNQVGQRSQVAGTQHRTTRATAATSRPVVPRAPDREMQDSIYSASLPIMTIKTVAIRAARRAPEIFAAVAPEQNVCQDGQSAARIRGQLSGADNLSADFL